MEQQKSSSLAVQHQQPGAPSPSTSSSRYVIPVAERGTTAREESTGRREAKNAGRTIAPAGRSVDEVAAARKADDNIRDAPPERTESTGDRIVLLDEQQELLPTPRRRGPRASPSSFGPPMVSPGTTRNEEIIRKAGTITAPAPGASGGKGKARPVGTTSTPAVLVRPQTGAANAPVHHGGGQQAQPGPPEPPGAKGNKNADPPQSPGPANNNNPRKQRNKRKPPFWQYTQKHVVVEQQRNNNKRRVLGHQAVAGVASTTETKYVIPGIGNTFARKRKKGKKRTADLALTDPAVLFPLNAAKYAGPLSLTALEEMNMLGAGGAGENKAGRGARPGAAGQNKQKKSKPLATKEITRDTKKMFCYGNFDTNYKHRRDRFQTIDVRILVLLKYLQLPTTTHYTGDVFFGKKVLDIGCNTGTVAFALSAFCNAKQVVGVDVDMNCTKIALKHLRKIKADGVEFFNHPEANQSVDLFSVRDNKMEVVGANDEDGEPLDHDHAEDQRQKNTVSAPASPPAPAAPPPLIEIPTIASVRYVPPEPPENADNKSAGDVDLLTSGQPSAVAATAQQLAAARKQIEEAFAQAIGGAAGGAASSSTGGGATSSSSTGRRPKTNKNSTIRFTSTATHLVPFHTPSAREDATQFADVLVQNRSVIPYVTKPYLMREEPPLIRKKSDFDFPYNLQFSTEDFLAPRSLVFAQALATRTTVVRAQRQSGEGRVGGRGNATMQRLSPRFADQQSAGAADALVQHPARASVGGGSAVKNVQPPVEGNRTPRTPQQGRAGQTPGTPRSGPRNDLFRNSTAAGVPAEQGAQNLLQRPPTTPTGKNYQSGPTLSKHFHSPRALHTTTTKVETNLFDTVLLFSVTKWIHMNCGDRGIELLFDRCWEVLKPNGVLILEYHPWQEYATPDPKQGGRSTTTGAAGENKYNEKSQHRKRKHASDFMQQNVLELKHRPENFRQLLCQNGRFGNVQVIHKDRFPALRRTLYLFTKYSKSTTTSGGNNKTKMDRDYQREDVDPAHPAPKVEDPAGRRKSADLVVVTDGNEGENKEGTAHRRWTSGSGQHQQDEQRALKRTKV
ncbi:unnamed protein product [Amoebophrya sp. A120]|nr:unnamed protein product [Amoebophrya sp. A120]|eukprot:GSA120T00025051001.1